MCLCVCPSGTSYFCPLSMKLSNSNVLTSVTCFNKFDLVIVRLERCLKINFKYVTRERSEPRLRERSPRQGECNIMQVYLGPGYYHQLKP